MTSSMLRRQLKNLVQNYSEAEVKVREATSNDPWGPSSSQMADISDLTYNVVACNEIMTMLWKRLKDDKNWRHIHKSLTLLEYLLKTGDDRVLLKMKDNIYIVKALTEYRFVEKDGKDQGANVSEKAKVVLVLMEDDEKLKEEREFAMKTREKTSKSSAASSTDTLKDPNYKPCYVPGAIGLPSLDNIPSVADLTANFTARKEERLKQEAEKKEVERRAKMSEDELKWEDAGKGSGVAKGAWGKDNAEKEEAKTDAWGAPKEPKEATDPWGTPTKPDTAGSAASSDPWGTPAKIDENSFAASKTDEDPFAAPKNVEDPFAATKDGSHPFSASKDKEYPFAASKDKADPFSSSNNDPFSAPKDDPFNARKDDPFNTPKDDPFNEHKDDPFNTPKEDPFSTPKDDPFNTPKDDPFNEHKDDPFNTPKDDPFNMSKDDPFNASRDDAFNARKDDPFSTPIEVPFNTPKDDSFNAPASTSPKEDPFAAQTSSKDDVFTASTTPLKKDAFSAPTKPTQDGTFVAQKTPPKEDPFAAPSSQPKHDASDPFSAPPVSSSHDSSDAWGALASSPPATAADPWGNGTSISSPVDISDGFGDASKLDNDPWGDPASVNTDDAWGSLAPPSDSSPSSDPFGDISKKGDPWGAPSSTPSNGTGKRTVQEQETYRKTALFLGSAGASLVDLDNLFSSNAKPRQHHLVDMFTAQTQAIGSFKDRGPTSGRVVGSGAVGRGAHCSPFGSTLATSFGFGAAHLASEAPLFHLLPHTVIGSHSHSDLPQMAPFGTGTVESSSVRGDSQVRFNRNLPHGGAGMLQYGGLVGDPLVNQLLVRTGMGQSSYFVGNQPVGVVHVGGFTQQPVSSVSGNRLGEMVNKNNPFLF